MVKKNRFLISQPPQQPKHNMSEQMDKNIFTIVRSIFAEGRPMNNVTIIKTRGQTSSLHVGFHR